MISDDALIPQLGECRCYRKAYRFCSILLNLALSLVFLLSDGLSGEDLLIVVILFATIFTSASSNNSWSDLFEAISASRPLNANLPSPQREQDAVGQSATAESIKT